MSELITRTITGGTVAIEDGIKAKEEFAPARKAKVELSFTVPDGLEGTNFLNGVADIAEQKLAELLGRPTKTSTTTTVVPTQAVILEPAAKKRGPKPKAAELSDKDKLAQAAGVLEEDTAAAVVEEEDSLGDLLGDAAPVPVTDAELGKAAQEKNAKMKAEFGEKWAPAKIRDLVAEFAGAGKRLNDVPAPKRAEFLARLEALK